MRRDRLSILVIVTALVAVGLVGAALITPSGADANESHNRTITVDASGSADAPPDQAVIRVAAVADGDDPGAVRDALATNSTALRESLADAGVTNDSYETAEYRVRGSRPHPDRPARPDYRGVHELEVTLDDPERAGAVIDAAADAAAEVRTVEFTLSPERRAELRTEAIDAVVSDARTQAEAIADTAGLSITDAVTVDASERRYRPVSYETAAGSADAGGTSVETGPVSVTYQAEVTYDATLD